MDEIKVNDDNKMDEIKVNDDNKMDEIKVNDDNKKMFTMEQAILELKNREKNHFRLVGIYQDKETKYKTCLEMAKNNDSNEVKNFLQEQLEKFNNDRNKALLDMYFAFKQFGEFVVQVQEAQLKELNNTIIYLKEKYPEIQKEFPNSQETNSLNTKETKQEDVISVLEEVKQEDALSLLS